MTSVRSLLLVPGSWMWTFIFLASSLCFAVQSVWFLCRTTTNHSTLTTAAISSYHFSSALWELPRRNMAVESGGTENNKLDDDHTPLPTLTACLLVKDDNALLNEWLAYHYHTWNLRHVHVAVDPTSVTSPQPIWDAWQNRINITQHVDDDFVTLKRMPHKYLRNGVPLAVAQHRYRQLAFLGHCVRQVAHQTTTTPTSSNRRNHQFLVHIDTDEFLTLNPLLQIRPPPADDWLEQPGASMRILQKMAENETWAGTSNLQSGCLSLPRLLFGPKQEEAEAEPLDLAAAAASFFATQTTSVLGAATAKRFETLRWQYHADYNDTQRNAQPKVLLDLAAIPRDDNLFAKRRDRVPGYRLPFSIHRPSQARCRRIGQLDLHQISHYPLAVHHYLGTYARYAARADGRRSRALYQAKAEGCNTRQRHSPAPWLTGFLRSTPHARTLLQSYFNNDDVLNKSVTANDEVDNDKTTID